MTAMMQRVPQITRASVPRDMDCRGRLGAWVSAGALVAVFAWAGSAVAGELPGFPVPTVDEEPESSPAVADLDGDGVLDIVFGAGHQVFAVDARGRVLAGWPVTLDATTKGARSRIVSSPAICALDGLGAKTVVIGGPDASLHALMADGTPRPGFPIPVDAQISSPPTCADVNGDASPDIVVAVPGKHVTGYDRRGKRLKGFPVRGVVPAESAIAAADLVPGGPLELIVGGDDGRLHFFNGLGKVDASRNARTRYRITGGASLGDVDGDGRFDIVFGSQDFNLYAVDGATGEAKPGFPVKTGYRIYGSPALGDLNDDGIVDIVVGSGDGWLYGVDGRGAALPGWPVKLKGRVEGTPAIGDLDLDGQNEVVAISASGFVYVFQPDGRIEAGSPMTIAGKNATSPVVVELDAEGAPEVIVLARGSLHAFTNRSRGAIGAARIPWPTYGHDAERVSRTRPNPASFTDLRIEPAAPRTTDALRVEYRYADLDGTQEGQTRIAWFRDGVRVSELEGRREVPPALTRKGERWSVRLQEEDDYRLFDEREGARYWMSDVVEVRNTPPGAPMIASTLGTSAPLVTDTLGIRIDGEAPDVDGDAIRYRVLWTVDETPVSVPGDGMQLPAGRARHGQRVAALVVPSDGAGDGETASFAWRMGNAAPLAPALHLEPAGFSRATGVRIVIDRAAVDPDGTEPHLETRWTLDGKALPLAADAMVVPGALLRRGAVLAVDVRAHDGGLASAPVHLEGVVGNQAPGAPRAELVPANPTASTPLGLVVVTPAPDADGDVPRYLVSWMLDGAEVPSLKGAWIVPAAQLKKGQRWRATLVADDGVAQGPPASVEIQIGNRAPLPPVVSIDPPQALAGDALSLKVRTPASDPDGDPVQLSIEWLVDDRPVASRPEDPGTLPAGIVRKGQTVQVRVTPRDELDAGPGVGDTLVVGDRPPGAPVVRLEPAAPRTGDEVRAILGEGASDPDGDPIRYRYHWVLDGARAELAEDTTTLPAALTRQGMQVAVQVVAVAAGRVSLPAEASTVVVPTPPPSPVVAIEPTAPLPGEPLRVRVVEQQDDPDGKPLSYDIVWLRDGAEAARGVGVNAGVTRKNEGWQVRVVAVDADGRSGAASAEVRIRNRPPTPPQISLTAREVSTERDVSVAVRAPATDPDGDPVRLDIRWEKDGAPAPAFDGATSIPASATRKGEEWRVRVVARDDVDAAPPATDAFRVLNSPPPPVTPRLVPLAPLAGAALGVEVTSQGADADGDALQYRFRFLVNGVPVSQDPANASLAPTAFARGDRVVVEVVPFDGEDVGPPARTAATVVNSPPQLAGVLVQPAQPTPGDTLRCEPSQPLSDADGDALRLLVSWEVNGRAQGAAGADATLLGAQLVPGDSVRCRAVATDGQLTSAEQVSEGVTLLSRAPTGLQVALFPPSPRSGEALRCGSLGDVRDLDGDVLQVDVVATIDGKALEAAEIPAAQVRRGKRVGCRATLRDAALPAPPAVVEAVVRNALPLAPALRLQPSSPRAGVDALTCEVETRAVDPEGDKLRYRIEWLRGGKPAALPPNAREVPARELRAGELWSCRVYAQDEEGEGAPGASAPVLVRPADDTHPVPAGGKSPAGATTLR